jgi:molybdopterin molybdotransferase
LAREVISIEEAQARIFGLKASVSVETVPLLEAAGRWAAEDVVALRTQPARDLSAMDGYAVRFADAAGPWRLIGESAAGKRFAGSVGAGEAVRIFTGAVVPEGADSVIIQENVTRDGDIITLTGDALEKLGQNVRREGADFRQGTTLISKGAELHARHIALAAMAGHGTLAVRRRIKVAIFSTGDELVAPGKFCAEDQIPSSNDVMLAAMLRDMPVDVTLIPAVSDDLDTLAAQFARLTDHDIIVTTGGASVGDHDLIVPALKAAGGKIDFWKIAMRPGKPVIAGTIGEAVVLGLPGNPVSAFVTAFLLLLSLIRHLGGARQPLPKRLTAISGAVLPVNGARTDHLRALLLDGVITPVGVNDSALLAALSTSNALIIRDIDDDAVVAGVKVCYYALPS